jgi:hypothetical protein
MTAASNVRLVLKHGRNFGRVQEVVALTDAAWLQRLSMSSSLTQSCCCLCKGLPELSTRPPIRGHWLKHEWIMERHILHPGAKLEVGVLAGRFLPVVQGGAQLLSCVLCAMSARCFAAASNLHGLQLAGRHGTTQLKGLRWLHASHRRHKCINNDRSSRNSLDPSTCQQYLTIL